MRGKTRQINVGTVKVGGGAPVSIQSMCNTDTRDARATLRQIEALAAAGCDIVRIAVPDMAAAEALREIKPRSPLPVVADIHFDYRLALASVDAGADKIRINPGNIGADKIKLVADACRGAGVPIRVGVNGGSLERDLRESLGVTPQALCQSALRNIRMLEEHDFHDICVSIKLSNVNGTVQAYRMLAENCLYPLHLGVTEAGGEEMGTLKSAAAFGALLCDGIGDTVRVSLTADPVREVYAAKKILKALDMGRTGIDLVACPTCGRTQIDLIGIYGELERRLAAVKTPLRVAVMGCAVNGPGEAREADVGVACGVGEGLIFKKGEIVGKVPGDEIIEILLREIEKMTGEEICRKEQN
ncbi:MAG: flavodoxin-dependent (E)-4-hydroxy-3-methylbut-2-enyl-diphosphate synthase [Clostridia bacterium]|nr:flavodoxin-dependent (E)-4-hydroxy-3-methylbut-2-enyl-diphosphate synthase [Clostridia bacterium]